MNAEPKVSQIHFHIRWSNKQNLDWATFPTREKAEAFAKELVLQGESYTVEERDGTCERCAVGKAGC